MVFGNWLFWSEKTHNTSVMLVNKEKTQKACFDYKNTELGSVILILNEFEI